MSQKEINNHKNRNKSALPGESGGKTKKTEPTKKQRETHPIKTKD